MSAVFGPDGTEPAAQAFQAVLATVADPDTKRTIRTLIEGHSVMSTDGDIEVAWVGISDGAVTISIRNGSRPTKIVYWMVIESPNSTQFTAQLLQTIRTIHSPTAASWQLPDCCVLSVVPRLQ